MAPEGIIVGGRMQRARQYQKSDRNRWKKRCILNVVFGLYSIGGVNADIGFGSYSYKYLSAVVQIGPQSGVLDSYIKLTSEGAYGYSSSYGEIEGQLLQPTNVLTGCGGAENVLSSTIVKYPTSQLATNESAWIALIERGDCMFTEKIKNAYDQNPPASGAIIYNNQDGIGVVPMEYQQPDPDFVAIMVDWNSYEQIQTTNKTYNNAALFTRIVPGSPQVNNSFERIVIATISVSFLILLALSVGWVVIYYVQRFRVIHRRYREAKRRQDMAERAIKMLKNKKLKKSEKCVTDEDQCPICIDNFLAGANCLELPCHHLFHKKCIEPWVLDKGTCPMCKLNVFVALGLETPEQASQNNRAQNVQQQPVWGGGDDMRTTTVEVGDGNHEDITFDQPSSSRSSSLSIAAATHDHQSRIPSTIHTNVNNSNSAAAENPGFNNSAEDMSEFDPTTPSHLVITQTHSGTPERTGRAGVVTLEPLSTSAASSPGRSAPASPLPGVEEVVIGAEQLQQTQISALNSPNRVEPVPEKLSSLSAEPSGSVNRAFEQSGSASMQ